MSTGQVCVTPPDICWRSLPQPQVTALSFGRKGRHDFVALRRLSKQSAMQREYFTRTQQVIFTVCDDGGSVGKYQEANFNVALPLWLKPWGRKSITAYIAVCNELMKRR